MNGAGLLMKQVTFAYLCIKLLDVWLVAILGANGMLTHVLRIQNMSIDYIQDVYNNVLKLVIIRKLFRERKCEK